MNNIILSGTVLSIEKSHEIYGEKFYKAILSSERSSGNCDELICIVPECYKESFAEGCKSAFHGEIRTRNIYDGDMRRVDTYVFVDEIVDYLGTDENFVEMVGYVCNEAKTRETPFGRIISDVLIASNRERSNKSDYIHCIAWGRNAVRIPFLKKGTKIFAKGRFQSRNYIKKHDDGAEEQKTAYEISISTFVELEE